MRSGLLKIPLEITGRAGLALIPSRNFLFALALHPLKRSPDFKHPCLLSSTPI